MCPLGHFSGPEWGPRHWAGFLKVQVQQLPGTLARVLVVSPASVGCHVALAGWGLLLSLIISRAE